jgi:hypothetical protein
MRTFALVAGIVWIFVIMWDAFEALVLPRRVTRRLRPTRFFYRSTWGLWSCIARGMRSAGRRETYLSFYGPLSLLVLLAAWAASLVAGFAVVQWGLGTRLHSVSGPATPIDDLYMSATTFFTLGLGDVTPVGAAARVVTAVEAGIGFGFLAMVIGYLPVVYQAFSRREVTITLLDARAGSPPSAVVLLERHASDHAALERLLYEWEHWSAEFLESHISYPVVAYFRSQHDNQSWLGALTTVLDASALVIAGTQGGPGRQARLTFAMARHAVVDIAQVLSAAPDLGAPNRLRPDGLAVLRDRLSPQCLPLLSGDAAEKTLEELRAMYEPYVAALSRRLLMDLPPWLIDRDPQDNWRTTAWGDGDH